MPTPATSIDECIQFTPNYVARIAYGTDAALKTQMTAWITGLFPAAGVFPPAGNGNPTYRKITDWYAQHLLARAAIEGPAIGDAGVVGTSAVINAVERILFAIKTSATTPQKTAVVTLWNSIWAIPAATVAATLTTATDMTPAVNVTDGVISEVWTAILTWSELGEIGIGKKLNYAETVRAPDLEVRDNQRYDLGTNAWVAEPGTVGIANGDVANVTVADIEAAINSVSTLCSVTTADAAHAAYTGDANTTCEGDFSGGL
jgi:hypothetical protein